MNELRDKDLREALSRREAQRTKPEVPADFLDSVMQRIEEPVTVPQPRAHRVWLYAAVAVAASIVLLIVFRHSLQQTPQEPLVAQQTVEQPMPQPVSEVSEPVAEPVEVVEAPEPVVAEAQPAQKPVKKQREVVMQLVELIPTSEAKSTNMKTLPESLIAKVKAYDQQSDPSRMTGIDDGTDAIVTTTMDIDEDPLVAMAAQVEDIRQRGQRLQQEIDKRFDN
ncbi:MAG: hypothetical protein J5658_12440 [Prevotella sp.]|nr:hypothetical protein [Prevotella sp.]